MNWGERGADIQSTTTSPPNSTSLAVGFPGSPPPWLVTFLRCPQGFPPMT